MNLKLAVLSSENGDTIALIDMDSDYVKYASNVSLLSYESVLQKRVLNNIEAFRSILSDDNLNKLL